MGRRDADLWKENDPHLCSPVQQSPSTACILSNFFDKLRFQKLCLPRGKLQVTSLSHSSPARTRFSRLFGHHWVQYAPTSLQFIFTHQIPNLRQHWLSGKLRYPGSLDLKRNLEASRLSSFILGVSSGGGEVPGTRSQSLLTDPRWDISSPTPNACFCFTSISPLQTWDSQFPP